MLVFGYLDIVVMVIVKVVFFSIFVSWNLCYVFCEADVLCIELLYCFECY